MPALDEAKPVHARWSEVNRGFLEFVEREPRCLHRSAFQSIYDEASLHCLSIQPWPLFIDRARQPELEAIAVPMDRLLRGVMERFFGGDPARIAEFYRTHPGDGEAAGEGLTEALIELLLEEPNGIWSAPSRTDYIETADGFKCIEYNAGSSPGGLQADTLGELYLASEPTARFLAERGLRARAPESRRAFFRHVVHDTVKLGAWDGGEFVLAMIVLPHDALWAAQHRADVYTRELRGVLAASAGPVRDGRVLCCAIDDFRFERGGVTRGGRPVHAVVEMHNGEGDIRGLYRAFKMGGVNLFSGPIGELMSDKRGIALLSTHADSDEFTADERALIARHIPWTRVMAPAVTERAGRPFRLPDDLVGRREEFVLKKASSVGGSFVDVGRHRTQAQWEAAVARALREGDWVVQEYLPTVPYWFQSGAEGAAPHDVVWGLFAFGGEYGGAFLRMYPAAGDHDGVVNNRRGADAGALLEIEP
jgi:hypothetical protein